MVPSTIPPPHLLAPKGKGQQSISISNLTQFWRIYIFFQSLCTKYSIPTVSPLLPRSTEERVTMTQDGDAALALMEAPQQSSEVIHGPTIQFRATTRLLKLQGEGVIWSSNELLCWATTTNSPYWKLGEPLVFQFQDITKPLHKETISLAQCVVIVYTQPSIDT